VANLTRYNLAVDGEWEVESVGMGEHPEGEWVKFEDVKEFLKTPTNRPIMPCPKCELSCKMQLSYCGWCGLHLDVRCPVTA
jgi:hypothetical protein